MTESLPSARLMQKRFAGFEIAVHDAEGVGLGDGLAGLEDEVDGQLGGERPALLEPRGEVPAVEVLHHHVGDAVLQSSLRR